MSLYELQSKDSSYLISNIYTNQVEQSDVLQYRFRLSALVLTYVYLKSPNQILPTYYRRTQGHLNLQNYPNSPGQDGVVISATDCPSNKSLLIILSRFYFIRINRDRDYLHSEPIIILSYQAFGSDVSKIIISDSNFGLKLR